MCKFLVLIQTTEGAGAREEAPEAQGEPVTSGCHALAWEHLEGRASVFPLFASPALRVAYGPQQALTLYLFNQLVKRVIN